MRKFFRLKSWLTAAALGIGLILSACVGLNPASAPAPVAEIPSNLPFPDDIGVSTPEVGPADTGAGALVAKAVKFIKNQVLPIGGEFFEAITFGFEINVATDQAVGAILLDLQNINVPVSATTTTFEVTGPTGGTFLGNGIKIDFADFDYFGDGTTVGCTGCTCPTGCDSECPTEAPVTELQPICFRIWVDQDGNGNFRRLMAGFFTRLATFDDPDTPEDEYNPGIGNYRVSIETGSSNGGPAENITNLGANYNHLQENPLNLFTEYYLSIVQPFSDILNARNSFVKVEQDALPGATREDQVLKTIRESVNQEDFMDPDFDSTFQYIARYRTDFDFWSGTWLNNLVFPEAAFVEPPPEVPNFTAECAQLSTAIGVDKGTCVDLGIDVTNVPFLDLLTSTDQRVNLPADFPATPTF